jgi:hypothetical protein
MLNIVLAVILKDQNRSNTDWQSAKQNKIYQSKLNISFKSTDCQTNCVKICFFCQMINRIQKVDKNYAGHG